MVKFNFYDYCFFGILIVIFLYFLVGGIFGIVTAGQCKNICEEKGALYSYQKVNGQFNIKDYCTCFYAQRSESFILNVVAAFLFPVLLFFACSKL